jgi:hypothetical protein
VRYNNVMTISVPLVDEDAESDDLNAISKLVEALIEHSAGWMVGKLDQPDVQSFLGLLLSLTGFPGLPGRDENVSEVSDYSVYIDLHQAISLIEEHTNIANFNALLFAARRVDGESRFPSRLCHIPELDHCKNVLYTGCQYTTQEDEDAGRRRQAEQRGPKSV